MTDTELIEWAAAESLTRLSQKLSPRQWLLLGYRAGATAALDCTAVKFDEGGNAIGVDVREIRKLVEIASKVVPT